MEQRRFTGHNLWLYESQARPYTSTTAPLVPEAAMVNDRFLLGLQQEATVLQPLFRHFQPALLAARDVSQLLFPDSLTASHTHTLTLYDRLSAALTVAQVAGVQRLCNHYSARLNPLPGPDSSRESNNRLTQMTQYARQLAMQPALINAHSLGALEAVGLTEPDIITLTQIIGFTGFQARMVAGVQALLAQPVRWIPGASVPPDACATLFAEDHLCSPGLKPLERRYASPQQLSAQADCLNDSDLEPLSWLLMYDAPVLSGLQRLKQQLMPVNPEAEALALAVSARIHGCRQRFTRYAGERREALLADAAHNRDAVAALSGQLTRQPDRFSAAHLQPLINSGWDHTALFTLLQRVALASWEDRLTMALAETRQS